MRALPLSLVALAASLAGCGPVSPEAPAAEAPARTSRALTSDNGTSLNGTSLNGTSLNGTDLTGFLVSVNYNPTWLESEVPLDRVWLEGTTFKGERNGRQYAGLDFVGAQFIGNLGDGSPLKLRVRSITPAPAPNEDLSLYDVEYRGEDNEWYPACHDNTGAPTLALPVQGVWDYRQGVDGGGSKLDDPSRFTFGCLGAAIAKCALWGYRPWATYNGVPLARYHQACTRLVRADYCGNGTPYTHNGNPINFYDDLGIQQDTENWVFEAVWDEHGARCFSLLNRSHANVPCYNDRLDQFCALRLGPNEASIVNETPNLGVLDSVGL